MGQVPRSKLVVLIVCFLVTSLLVYTRGSSNVTRKPLKLGAALSGIPGWKLVGTEPLDLNIIKGLKVDDYINAIYSNATTNVSLYIGYYYSAKKVGAAHHPLVCFPGQGWTVSRTKTGALVFGSPKRYKIPFSSMVVKRGDQRNLVIYWFQSYDKANTNTFSQKVSSFFQRLHHDSQGNAFVRITTDMKGKTREEAQRSIEAFIRAFYPLFLKYIKNEIS